MKEYLVIKAAAQKIAHAVKCRSYTLEEVSKRRNLTEDEAISASARMILDDRKFVITKNRRNNFNIVEK